MIKMYKNLKAKKYRKIEEIQLQYRKTEVGNIDERKERIYK